MVSLKNTRISKKKDFDKIFREGKAVRGSFFLIYWLKKESGEKRIAIVVSSKAFPKAVERNKIRRKIRAVIYGNFQEIEANVDMVIVVNPKVKELKHKELEQSLKEILVKANIARLALNQHNNQ